MTATHVVELEHVKFGFRGHTIHNDVSFSVAPGEGVVILGGSGTGKTLLLKLIEGLVRPDAGDIRVMGARINDLNEEDLAPIRRQIGMVFQGAALFDSLTVYENIAYSLRELGEMPESQIADTVQRQLELIGLPSIEHKYPNQLSGGQKKRVGLARALARGPKVVLFDEPTTGLDPTATRLIDDLIVKLREEHGITTISVTHDIASARRIGSRWILIGDGKVLADGDAEELSQHEDRVKRFISGNWE